MKEINISDKSYEILQQAKHIFQMELRKKLSDAQTIDLLLEKGRDAGGFF